MFFGGNVLWNIQLYPIFLEAIRSELGSYLIPLMSNDQLTFNIVKTKKFNFRVSECNISFIWFLNGRKSSAQEYVH